MEQQKKRSPMLWLWLTFLAVFAFYVIGNDQGRAPRAQTVAISDLMTRIEHDEVKSVAIDNGTVRVILKEQKDGKDEYLESYTEDTGSLSALLKEHDVEFRYIPPQKESFLQGVLPTLLLAALFIGVPFFLLTRMMKGQMGAGSKFGNHKARLIEEEKVKTRFTDIGGAEEAIIEASELVDMLKFREKYKRMGATIPKGVLLMGPPGTGKTHMAKAIAGEAGRPFFSASGSGFVEMFVGVGASRVRSMFEEAKKHAPCIIFIDEIDGVGSERGHGHGGGHDEREQTLNQILTEMEGFEENSGIIVIAATNRPEVLDKALVRPGRFDTKIVMDRPDVKGRQEILRIHSKNKPLASDVDLRSIAIGTPGMTGADLRLVLDKAAALATRSGRTDVTMDDLERAKDIVLMGTELKSKVLNDRDKKIVAYHEAGHAVVMHFTPLSHPVRKVSIIRRGLALGVTMSAPEEENVLHSKNELISMILGLLGGRAAEELVMGDVTTGASDDLNRASSLARRLVKNFGMTDLGLVTYGNQEQTFLGFSHEARNFSETMATKIDEKVAAIMSSCYERVKTLLVEQRGKLDALAQELIQKEVTLESDIRRILGDRPVPSAATALPKV